MVLPLAGVRVLDMTVAQQAPVATAMLADMGADVIKVEQKDVGDPGRATAASLLPGESALSWYFEACNRNKRAVALDLKKDHGREALCRLVKKADVFVSNFRAKALDRLGLDYESLARINPGLIYAAGSGYGNLGPDKDKPALDHAAQARGGIMMISGEADGPPARLGAGVADQVGAMLLAYGVMVALFHRERTGIGQRVDVSLLGGQAWLGALSLQAFLFTEVDPPRYNRTENPNVLWNTYQGADGKWLCLGCLGVFEDRYWPTVCEVLGLSHLIADPRFETHPQRMENASQIIAAFDRAFAARPVAEWLTIFDKKDVICSPVNTYADVAKDPQLWANDYIVELDHHSEGRVKYVGTPVRLSKTPGGVRNPAPELGQHTEEILVEMGGYTWDEVVRLKEEEVI